MRLAGLVCAALALHGAVRAQEAEPRAQTLDRLAQLESLERGAAGAEDLAAELETIAREGGATPFARLLGARLARWAERPLPTTIERLAGEPLHAFSPREAWLLAEIVPPGATCVRVVMYALRGTMQLSRAQLEFAWNTAVAEARALRLAEGALPIQELLHERYGAAWSAVDLALTQSRLGDREGLDRVLGSAIERERAAGRATAELWSRWGIATLGFGDEARARDYLGRALAEGSTDAALVLGKAEFESGHAAAARASWRPSILSDTPSPWALRGWGLTLLPKAHTLPATPSPGGSTAKR